MTINTKLCILTLSAGTLMLVGCGQGMRGIGASILSSTGHVSYSQADALFEVGEGLSKAAQTLTPEEEYFLGRGVSAMLLHKYPPLENARSNQYINRVGQLLARVSDRPDTFNGYRFMLLDSPEVNAFATPGGFIFVTRGLLSLLPDEDALAAVLAHEVAHIVNGDGLRAISQAHLTHALAVVGREAASEAVSQAGAPVAGALTSAFSGSVQDVFETMVTKGYSRSQEYAADKYAVELLNRAGYNPRAMITVLAALEKANGEGGFFETHPSAEDRREEVEELVTAEATPTVGEKVREKRYQRERGKV